MLFETGIHAKKNTDNSLGGSKSQEKGTRNTGDDAVEACGLVEFDPYQVMAFCLSNIELETQTGTNRRHVTSLDASAQLQRQGMLLPMLELSKTGPCVCENHGG